MDAMVAEGVTSFKLCMAYRGVLMLDDGSIFRAFTRTAENGGTICMHAENGDVIDVLVRRAVAEGRTAPKFHALTRPARAEAEATYRAICLSEMAGATRSLAPPPPAARLRQGPVARAPRRSRLPLHCPPDP